MAGGGGGDDPLANLPSAMDDVGGGLPTAPRPAAPSASEDETPAAPQPYQRSSDSAPAEPSQEQQPQQQQPQQPQQQQMDPMQQQMAPGQIPMHQPLPGQQLPGGPLMQPGMPAQPGMPQGGMATQGMPMPAPYGAMTVQPGQTMVAGGPAPVQVQQEGGEEGAKSEAGPMPMVTLIAGIAAILTCSGVIIGPAAIIMGHLMLIKVDNDDKPAKMKTTIGLILGYASLIFLLLGIVIGKLVAGAQAE